MTKTFLGNCDSHIWSPPSQNGVCLVMNPPVPLSKEQLLTGTNIVQQPSKTGYQTLSVANVASINFNSRLVQSRDFYCRQVLKVLISHVLLV